MYMKNLEQSQPRVRTLLVVNILLVGHTMSNAREGSPLGHRPMHHWAPACTSSPDFFLENSYLRSASPLPPKPSVHRQRGEYR